jgi:predicted signal transduction protein with EAL and GGDEF domain
VVVEGTETEEQIAWLSALGEIEAQGFLFSRPVPADAIPALIARYGVYGGGSSGGAARRRQHGHLTFRHTRRVALHADCFGFRSGCLVH